MRAVSDAGVTNLQGYLYPMYEAIADRKVRRFGRVSKGMPYTHGRIPNIVSDVRKAIDGVRDALDGVEKGSVWGYTAKEMRDMIAAAKAKLYDIKHGVFAELDDYPSTFPTANAKRQLDALVSQLDMLSAKLKQHGAGR